MSFARVATIPGLARKLGMSRRTLFRQLLKWHARDRAERPEMVGWLYRFEGGTWRVNVGLLRKAHPGMFEPPTIEDVEARVTTLEREFVSLKQSNRAIAGSLRRHREHEERDGDA